MTLPEAGDFIATITTTSELRSAASHRRTLMPPHSPSGGASAMSRREVRKGHRSTQVNLPACPGRDWQPSCCQPHTDGGNGQCPVYETFRNLWKRDRSSPLPSSRLKRRPWAVWKPRSSTGPSRSTNALSSTDKANASGGCREVEVLYRLPKLTLE